MHTTNYQDTFIEVAEDCPVTEGQVPPSRGLSKSAAALQFELLSASPYRYTSDDILFRVYAEKSNLPASEYKAARERFFSKGQPCFRASPLTKRYGWGVHSDEDGKIAIYGRETPEYKKFKNDSKLKILKAMKSAK